MSQRYRQGIYDLDRVVTYSKVGPITSFFEASSHLISSQLSTMPPLTSLNRFSSTLSHIVYCIITMGPPATQQLKPLPQPSQFQLALALAVAKAKPEGISVRGMLCHSLLNQLVAYEMPVLSFCHLCHSSLALVRCFDQFIELAQRYFVPSQILCRTSR